mgnify:CR=1 FL=1
MQPRDYHRISLMQKLKLEEEGRLPPVNEKVPTGLFRNVSPKMFITSQTPAPKDAYAKSSYGKKQHYTLVKSSVHNSFANNISEENPALKTGGVEDSLMNHDSLMENSNLVQVESTLEDEAKN